MAMAFCYTLYTYLRLSVSIHLVSDFLAIIALCWPNLILVDPGIYRFPSNVEVLPLK
jgi:hypothetical protein